VGKSLLTEILTARLEPPVFNTVRIELRDIGPETSPQSQIEQQIKDDVGREVSWPQFASALAGSPPLVILDGYDELLQSSGKTYSSYLTEVHRFQPRERVLGRPVRVIVTSRITLIDKAAIPVGTTVLRLLEFDERRGRNGWRTGTATTRGTSVIPAWPPSRSRRTPRSSSSPGSRSCS
jgi:hypothetical protein